MDSRSSGRGRGFYWPAGWRGFRGVCDHCGAAVYAMADPRSGDQLLSEPWERGTGEPHRTVAHRCGASIPHAHLPVAPEQGRALARERDSRTAQTIIASKARIADAREELHELRCRVRYMGTWLASVPIPERGLALHVFRERLAAETSALQALDEEAHAAVAAYVACRKDMPATPPPTARTERSGLVMASPRAWPEGRGVPAVPRAKVGTQGPPTSHGEVRPTVAADEPRYPHRGATEEATAVDRFRTEHDGVECLASTHEAEGTTMFPFSALREAPEQPIIQRIVRESRATRAEIWSALAGCGRLWAYTDGSAPAKNPSGPCGFAVVLIGWREPLPAPGSTATPDVRLDLGGHIPARQGEPTTSNNRAEIAGIMAALAALSTLPGGRRQVVIWSDSDYAISGATGQHKRKKNLDLWQGYDALDRQARALNPDGICLSWLKGHAGETWNEAADRLATLAAFDFDEPAYARLRAAQRATGREMPNMGAAIDAGVAARAFLDVPPVPESAAWIRDAHYTLVLCTHIDGGGRPGVGRGPATGRYQLWTRDGRGNRFDVRHGGERTADEAEYLTLIAALTALTTRIEGSNSDPARFTLTVYSRRGLVVNQLLGICGTCAPSLQPVQARALAQLGRFKDMELIWKQGPSIEQLLRP